jgi:adenine-specific DNA-methyltransferase
VIDEATKARLIAEDPRSAEVIKPFLAGREVKRYQVPKADKFLILFPKGWTIERVGDFNESVAFEYLKNQYPAIGAYLEPFASRARKRFDKGDFWWELRACDYYEEFEKDKVIYQEIATYQAFSLDNTGIYCNNKIFIIPEATRSLLAILNCKVTWFYLHHIATKYQGGAIAMQSIFVLSIPIPDFQEIESKLDSLVKQVKNLKQSTADTAALEAEIDALVYGLYGLTEAEVALVEGG